MLKLAISGITGRMGQACIDAASHVDGVMVTLGTCPKDANVVTPTAFNVCDDVTSGKINVKDFDVCIDFTNPEASLLHTKLCVDLQKPIVIGTTGFTELQWQQLKKFSQKIPILYSANMSIGVHVLTKALEQAGKIFSGEEVSVDILETHHKYKKDAPSGTALQLTSTLEAVMKRTIDTLQSIRSGNIVGEHEVRFGLPFERITFKHEAFDRKIFAHGAIKAAKWLALHAKSKGWFGLDDAFSGA